MFVGGGNHSKPARFPINLGTLFILIIQNSNLEFGFNWLFSLLVCNIQLSAQIKGLYCYLVNLLASYCMSGSLHKRVGKGCGTKNFIKAKKLKII